MWLYFVAIVSLIIFIVNLLVTVLIVADSFKGKS
jgi:hypothetical protein